MTATSTPANASSPANISPVGPPPTITTACSFIPPSATAILGFEGRLCGTARVLLQAPVHAIYWIWQGADILLLPSSFLPRTLPRFPSQRRTASAQSQLGYTAVSHAVDSKINRPGVGRCADSVSAFGFDFQRQSHFSRRAYPCAFVGSPRN